MAVATSYLTSAHRVLALAHRGFDLAGRENSMAAFAAARQLGIEHVETDAHVTSDGVAVALHDARLERTTDATGAVSALPWSRVRQARIGGTDPVPRLEDLLGQWPDLRVNIDVKADGAERAVAAAVERTGAHDRVLLTSFSAARRRRTLAALSRPVATSAGRSEIAAFLAAAALPDGAALPAARAALSQVDCLQVPERSGLRVVSARTVALAHLVGRPVHVWTVDDAADMHRLLDLGVDGLVTNRSDVLRDVLVTRGAW
ncbi:MAG: glycerophosphodiester phosphodiesterase [Micrococcales bacterium]|nr:glycerophosphodiester phosphodiesterase [Micrococcales bacterium]